MSNVVPNSFLAVSKIIFVLSSSINNWKLPINQKMKKKVPTQYKKDLGVTAIIKERKTP
jgi:hypothetical protein